MRASEILDAPVLAASGEQVGVVRDLRVVWEPAVGASGGRRFRVAGIVIGRRGWIDEAAHAWGFVEGRALGPWILSRLTAPARARARFAAVDQVASWGPGKVVLDAGVELRPFEAVIGK